MSRQQPFHPPGAPPKPRYRGVLHQFAAPATLAGAALLAAGAKSSAARAASALFGASIGATFTVSALYHRLPHASATIRERFQRADHATIFVGIAGSSTALAMLAMPTPAGAAFVGATWAAALVGVSFAARPGARCRRVADVLYGVVGWFGVFTIPALVAHAGWLTAGWVVASGALYSLGAVLFAVGRPHLKPAVFGYHEVWHTFTVLGAACHFVALWKLSRAT